MIAKSDVVVKLQNEVANMKNDVGAVKAQVHDVNTSVNVMKTQQKDGFDKLASLIQNLQNNNK
eukprot:8659556-Karenia_brevis.AAC.1